MAAPAPSDPPESEIDRIARLSCWRGRVEIAPLAGGLSNRNYTAADSGGRYVVRLGHDVPEHGILRRNEEVASRAAAAAKVSPALVHAEPGVLVFRFVAGRALGLDDMRRDDTLARALDLLRRAHTEIPRHIPGSPPAFRVFDVLRAYAATLKRGGSRMAGELPRLMTEAGVLEHAAGPEPPAFCHNDLLAANLIDDGGRLWLIDWEYGGLNAPLFDLANLASNNALDAAQTDWLLAAYDGRAPGPARRRAFAAMAAASLLREAMWSMVQEIHSRLPVDYVAYTRENLARYGAARDAFARTAA